MLNKHLRSTNVDAHSSTRRCSEVSSMLLLQVEMWCRLEQGVSTILRTHGLYIYTCVRHQLPGVLAPLVNIHLSAQSLLSWKGHHLGCSACNRHSIDAQPKTHKSGACRSAGTAVHTYMYLLPPHLNHVTRYLLIRAVDSLICLHFKHALGFPSEHLITQHSNS